MNGPFSLAVLAALLASCVWCQDTTPPPVRPFVCPPDTREIQRLFDQLHDTEDKREAIEKKLVQEGKFIPPKVKLADISHLRNTREDPVNRDKELKQLIFEAVSERLWQKYNLTSQEIAECLPKARLVGEGPAGAVAECRELEFNCQCDPKAKYRTVDGTCNNPNNPTWGAISTCFERTLPPVYVGISGFRESAQGGPLPEPRDLSLNVHNNLDRPTRDISHMYMFFGQLLDHEITQAPISITLDNLAIQCCVDGEKHPQCIPISIRDTDPFYSKFGTKCINVPRAALCPTCKLGPRQQINQITSFIDGSVFYGTSHAETLSLRTLDGTGRMRVQRTPVGDLLPPSPDPENDQCSFPETNDICFQAGDPRANEHPPLMSLQTIFVLEHNRLANDLRRQNRFWSGDRIFEEARKIVGAIFQAIVYQEYLPVTLGDQQLDRYNLRVTPDKRTEWEPNTNPSITNEFTAAAFRFSHTLINSVLANAPLNATNGKRLLRDQYFQAYDLHDGILSPILRSATDSPAQQFDRNVVEDVTNFLYRIRNTPAGLDLASINIQRGRDHGIPPYVQLARLCAEGRQKFRDWGEVVRDQVWSRANRDILQANYKVIDDVDLWTGLLSETPLPGAVVGPTTACIVGSQFRSLKYGDRFYYEHDKLPVSFTKQQVDEIRKMTLSKMICLNSEVTEIKRDALLLPSNNNPTIDCRTVEGINLAFWREK